MKRGNPTHGLYSTQRDTYVIWSSIKARCLYPRHEAYSRYGGRGIQICGRWRDDFPAFFADMGPRPTPDHSIDRIDNDGDYSPENCRWATTAEQSANRRDCYRIHHEGEVLSLADLCRVTGRKPAVTYKWVKLLGLGHEFDSSAILDARPASSPA